MNPDRYHQHVPDNPSVPSNSTGFLMSTDWNSGSTIKGFLSNMKDETPNKPDNQEKLVSNIESIRLLLEPDHKTDQLPQEPSNIVNPMPTNLGYSQTFYPNRVSPIQSTNQVGQYQGSYIDQSQLISQNEQLKLQEINDLKQQVLNLQQQIKELQKQPQQQMDTNNPSFSTPNPNQPLNDNTENQLIDPTHQNLFHPQFLQSNENSVKQEPKQAPELSNINTIQKDINFEKGEIPPFSVKFSFGTGQTFLSHTNPAKQFGMLNLRPISFNISKLDENKEETVDSTDSFLYKSQSNQTVNNENEKILFPESNAKLYLLTSEEDGKSFFAMLGNGCASITSTDNIFRILVKQNCIGNCLLNTRVVSKTSSKLNGNWVQFVGKNFDGNFDKSGKLSIYRIKFETPDKAKEFYQALNSIKTFTD